MKNLTIGVVAHVDAGKTTLSEGMLYSVGSIRKMGRVDNGDAFLDTYELERKRGITIFSKQAVFSLGDWHITLLDTPGHVDFSAEMERTLQVLDYALLVISGADGVQGHTQTLWRLLKKYQIPVFLFINKMDQEGTDKNTLLEELKSKLEEGCIDFTQEGSLDFYESLAVSDEDLLNYFLEHENIENKHISRMIKERKVFPCYFGSALKMQGIEEFLEGMKAYIEPASYDTQFGARVFKISRDEQGNRLTHLKVTGGVLKVKSVLVSEPKEEKVNQIRIYSGDKYQTVSEAEQGMICAVTGFTKTFPGQGLGKEEVEISPVLEPVLTYQVILPEGCSAGTMLPKLKQLEEEDPKLHIVWDENLQEIQIQMMGEVQLEVLKSLVLERFDTVIDFGVGSIVYKETITDTVEGVGHFEPLRHYAEVHLIMEPGALGSGIQIAASCSEDLLDKNWQRLILTHLMEQEHKGVLTGSPVTDMKITLVAGKAHLKHTEGGDFRQATYRAVRQGLKQAQSILLEPYYEFRLEIPQQMVGRAMTDLERMYGEFQMPETEGDMTVIYGSAPIATMSGYQKEVVAYTKGRGRFFCTFKGYEPCHNQEEVVARMAYDSEQDVKNPTGSVFCAHGAGFHVGWEQVKDYMHVPSVLQAKEAEQEIVQESSQKYEAYEEEWMDIDEIDRILEQTFYANQHNKSKWKKKKRIAEDYATSKVQSSRVKKSGKKYLLVDGYNIIYAWDDLRELAEVNIDAARGKLMDILCNYQAIKKSTLILVFDAYRVKGHDTEIMDYHNIHVVYTKEAETADQYIEKFAHNHGSKDEVTVATSDGLEQVIIRGQGCALLSAREFLEEVEQVFQKIREDYLEKQETEKNYLLDGVSLKKLLSQEQIKDQ